MLKDALPSLVVLALCDYDPYGLQILCTYAFGSMVRLPIHCRPTLAHHMR
jgi:DNA topoisomerase VI subunit A